MPPIELSLIVLALSMKESSDQAKLYKRIKEGDEEAFRTFFEEHYDGLFLFLRNRNVSRQAAEDLIQKAFIYIWQNRKKIAPEKSLKAYLFRIAYTRMINYFKQKKEFIEIDDRINGVSRTPHDAAEFNNLHETFQKTVADMPEKRRMVFESCFIQDLTYKETAENLSISVKTVENHMALAFKDLRKKLKIFNKN